MQKRNPAGPPAPDPDLDRLRREAVGIARESGSIIMKYRKLLLRGRAIGTEMKDDNSPVTIADKESSVFLVRALEGLTPSYPVVSEENDFDPFAEGVEDYWAVDPLDGTIEFIDGTSGFHNKLTLIRGGQPVLAVTYCPVQGVLYDTIEGDLSRKTDRSGTIKILETKQWDGQKPLRAMFNTKSGDLSLYQEWRRVAAGHGARLPYRPAGRPGLPRNLRVAEGLSDLYVATGHRGRAVPGAAYVWDIAGDDLMLRNAGGGLVRIRDGQVQDYTNPRRILPPYIGFGDPLLKARFFP